MAVFGVDFAVNGNVIVLAEVELLVEAVVTNSVITVSDSVFGVDIYLLG